MEVDETVDSLYSSGLPVIFSDTCSLLNTFEIFNDKRKENFLETFREVLKRIEDKKYNSVIVYKVAEEYEQNCSRTLAQLGIELNYFFSKMNHYISEDEKSKLTVYSDKLSSGVRGDVEKLLKQSLICSKQVNLFNQAVARMNNGEAPAHRGKRESTLGDCIIMEYISYISSQLRGKGYSQPIHFVSSNTKDFGTPLRPVDKLKQLFDLHEITLHNDYWYIVNNGDNVIVTS